MPYFYSIAFILNRLLFTTFTVLMKHSLDILVTVALEELPLRIHVHLFVCYQQIVATQLWQHVLLALDVSPFLL